MAWFRAGGNSAVLGPIVYFPASEVRPPVGGGGWESKGEITGGSWPTAVVEYRRKTALLMGDSNLHPCFVAGSLPIVALVEGGI